MQWQYIEVIRVAGGEWQHNGAPVDLDDLGSDGWLLVTSYIRAAGGSDVREHLFFKRVKETINDGTSITTTPTEG